MKTVLLCCRWCETERTADIKDSTDFASWKCSRCGEQNYQDVRRQKPIEQKQTTQSLLTQSI